MDNLQNNSGEIGQMLSGLDFPKSKQEVVDYAQNHGASEEIMSALNRLPDKVYNGTEDLLKEVETKM